VKSNFTYVTIASRDSSDFTGSSIHAFADYDEATGYCQATSTTLVGVYVLIYPTNGVDIRGIWLDGTFYPS
jgi:hypothetical protein